MTEETELQPAGSTEGAGRSEEKPERMPDLQKAESFGSHGSKRRSLSSKPASRAASGSCQQ